MMRLLVHGAGTALTGTTMIAIGEHFLGVAPPKENSPWWTKIQVALWRGELMGILSGLLHPGDWSEGVEDMFWPVLAERGVTFAQELSAAVKGFQTPAQATENIIKSSVSSYSQGLKLLEKQSNPYKVSAKRWRNLARDFEKEFDVKEEAEWARNLRTPYYKDLREYFESGTDAQFAKQYFLTVFAVANDMLNEGYIINIRNLDQALKEAQKVVDKKITNFNPNPASFYKDSDIAQLRALDFATWISDGMGKEVLAQMFKSESEYNSKVDKFNKTLPYFARQYNLQDMFKKHIKLEKKKRIKR